jgi:uncharacterized membrane protein
MDMIPYLLIVAFLLVIVLLAILGTFVRLHRLERRLAARPTGELRPGGPSVAEPPASGQRPTDLRPADANPAALDARNLPAGEIHAELKLLEERLAEAERKLTASVHEPRWVADLHARLEAIERNLAALAARPGATEEPVSLPSALPEVPAQEAPEPSSVAWRAGAPDLETLIAGRWLNRVGILALLLAIGFFLLYAFDRGWVPTPGRVLVGLLYGGLLMAYSYWLLRRGFLYFSESVTVLGAGVLYLSLYAAWASYHLLPQLLTYLCMMVVTAAIAGLALARRSLRVALVALVGGCLTPILLSMHTNQQSLLFTYIAIIDAGLVALGQRRGWRSLGVLLFLWTQINFWLWSAGFYRPAQWPTTLAFASLFFLIFLVPPVLDSRSAARMPGDRVVLLLADALAMLIVLHTMFWPEHLWTLTLGLLALAALFFLLARPGGPRAAEKALSSSHQLYAGLALVFLTLAISIRLEGEWVAMAWVLEGAALLWIGLRHGQPFLRGAGFLLFALIPPWLVFCPIVTEHLFWNPRFLTFLVAVACFAFILHLRHRYRQPFGAVESLLFATLSVAIQVLAVWALSLEVWDVFARLRSTMGMDTHLAQQLSLSLLWTLYASGLVVFGVRRASTLLRWQGLVLFGLVVGKVLFYDLASLERVYRVASLVGLGAVLWVISHLYQRRLNSTHHQER